MSVTLDHAGLQALLGVYAVDAIDDPDERAAVERHLAACADCRREVDEHLEAVAALTPAAAQAPAPVWEGIAETIGAAGAPAAPRTERPGRVIPFPARRALPAAASSAAAAAAAVLITLAVGGDDDLGTRVREAAIVPAARTVSLTGKAELYEPSSPDGVLVLDLRDVPPAPARHHYEVWVLRAGAAMEMEAVGAFAPRDGRARLVLSLPGPGTYVSVEISIEENGGPPAHSGRRLASVRF